MGALLWAPGRLVTVRLGLVWWAAQLVVAGQGLIVGSPAYPGTHDATSQNRGDTTDSHGDSRRIEYMPLDAIIPATSNPKRHAEALVQTSISRFGLASPPVLDERTGRLVAGHGRVEALTAMRDAGQDPPEGVNATQDGVWLVPVYRGWGSRSDPEASAYIVADNRHTELGGWDHTQLAALLDDLGDPDLTDLTGWDPADLEELLNTETEAEELPPALPPSDDFSGEPSQDPVTKLGDVWALGEHRIICGDCRDYSVVERLLGDVRVNVAFTSPPYASQRKYDQTSGFTPIHPDEYVDWFEDVQANIRAVLADDGSWFVNIKENSENGQRVLYVKDLVVAHVRRWGWLWIEELCWIRRPFPGSPEQIRRFKNGFEPIFQFAASKDWKFRPAAVMHESDSAFTYATQKSAGRKIQASNQGFCDGTSTAVHSGDGMAYPSNVLSLTEGAGVAGHPAAFTTRLPAWFIRAYSDVGDVVFDPFMGSGTTLLAAHQEGRVAYGTEISPGYCDLICRRFQEATGVVPVRVLEDGTVEPHDFGGEREPEPTQIS